jgi:predicted dehydrogenase
MKFVLIGCGSISKKHIESLIRIPEAEIVAVCDIDRKTAEGIANSHGIPFYTDYHDMAKNEEFNIFVILTPSGNHAKAILDLVQYGKHFVVEKPLTLRLSDADEIVKSCDMMGCKLFVVQQNRFNPPIIKLKEAIITGRFGKIVLATVRVRWCRKQEYYDQKGWRGTWAYDGGVLANQANHHVDMLSWLIGDVDSVKAMSATQLANIEAEDTAVAILKFRNGALGVIEATTATRPRDLEGSISVLGEKGSVEVGGFFMNELKIWNFEDSTDEDIDIFETHGKTPDTLAWNHTEFYKDVISCIKEFRRGLVDGIEGRRSLELINAIYESVETGKEVILRFVPKHTKLGEGQ